MRHGLFLLCFLLSGCVLVLPNSLPSANSTQPVTPSRPDASFCAEYVPPARHPLPKDFTVDDKDGGEYVELLQDLTTGLARSLNEYKNYIRAEHQDQDHAYAQHQASCGHR